MSKNGCNLMVGLDVDDTYVYVPAVYANLTELECAVVYAIDITKNFNYDNYTSEIGDVLEDTSSMGIDLRDFLLHSRAVGPMVLTRITKDFTTSDLNLNYTSPLNYPTFSFGWVRHSDPAGGRVGIWQYAPPMGQIWPIAPSDGYTTNVRSTTIDGVLVADKGSILVLRNPAIITDNTTNVTI